MADMRLCGTEDLLHAAPAEEAAMQRPDGANHESKPGRDDLIG